MPKNSGTQCQFPNYLFGCKIQGGIEKLGNWYCVPELWYKMRMALMTAAADTDPTIAKARAFGDKKRGEREVIPESGSRPGPCLLANLSPRRPVYRV